MSYSGAQMVGSIPTIENSINIEYMYAFSYGKGDKAIMVFRFENPDKAIEVLSDKNIDTGKNIDLFS